MNVTNSLLRGLISGSAKMKICVKLILELQNPDNFPELLRIAERTRKQGVVGFAVPADLRYEAAISEIQKAGFGITMPAYELSEIEFALDHGIKRLGNAFLCIRDDNLYARVLNRSNGIYIECCISLAKHEGHDHPIAIIQYSASRMVYSLDFPLASLCTVEHLYNKSGKS
eukprot:TRINITY_DN4948_c0_g1_i1.p1 TRINITY_DN4948_c0_g1~~TRINITY_DN4948_c0_g1_i1.p1  ORF type:complete len:171 (-),score=13.01 TRINITY_DN4948_c0_g1_i1:107-619(-)